MADAQQELDDEILSACHDGELPPTEAEAVRRRLAREPQLAERLHAMHCVDEAAAEAFRALDGEPVPARVLELLHAAEARQRERHPECAGEAPMALEPGPVKRRWRRRAALTAAIALAAGFSLGALLPDDDRFPAQALIGGSACERQPGGPPPAYARTVYDYVRQSPAL